MPKSANKEDVAATVLACTGWISKNRPYLTGGMLLSATYMVQEKDGDHYATISVQGPRGYEYFTFRVNLKNGLVRLLDEHE